MNILSKILVYSNLWVAFAVVGFSYISLSEVYLSHYTYLAFIFCSTVFAYNYMRLVHIKVHAPKTSFGFSDWVSAHHYQVFLIAIVSMALSMSFLKEVISWDFIYVMSPAVLVSIIYPLSFNKAFSSFSSLRVLPGLKLFLISATWAYVTVLVPIVLYSNLNWSQYLEFFFRTILVMGLVIPFDIRDIEHDDASMKTIPQVMGVKKARELSLFFLLLYQVWLIVRFAFFDAGLTYTLALLLGVEIGSLLIKQTNKRQAEGYYSFWIEGIPIYCALLLLLGRLLF